MVSCSNCHMDNTADSKFCKECATPLNCIEETSSSLAETFKFSEKNLSRGTNFANRYEIIEELGEGGMGKVYRAEDKKINEDIALKIIKTDLSSDKKLIKRVSNELKYARKIKHKNVCQMFDLGEMDGIHFITMEYISGENLKSFIRRFGCLTISKAISIAVQVCEGLAEAHRMGVIHRDLKPSNIMIDETGNAGIMDFGIARSLKAKGTTDVSVMIGTPQYMSPEQVEGKDIDQRSDLYSLGVVLFEMVTGQIPFRGPTALSIAMKHRIEDPENPRNLNPRVPEALSELILKCLKKKKADRFHSAEEVRETLIEIEEKSSTEEKKLDCKEPADRNRFLCFSLSNPLIPLLFIILFLVVAFKVRNFIPLQNETFPPLMENSLAVISFENQTGDSQFDYLKKVIPDLLIFDLEQTGYFHVVTWERMCDLLKQMGRADIEIIDREFGFELCRKEGIAAVVVGSFVKAGDTFATDLKVLDVETKSILKSARSTGIGLDSILLNQIDDLSRQIFSSLTDQPLDSKGFQIAGLTTSSLPAYNCYMKGRDALEKRYLDEAHVLLENAVSLDPDFAMAYRYLGLVCHWMLDYNARNQALEKAKSLSDKVTEKERLYIEAFYSRFVKPDSEKNLKILEEMAEKYPKEKQVYYMLGGHYQIKRDPKAIEMYKKALELDPGYGDALNQLGYTYLYLKQVVKR